MPHFPLRLLLTGALASAALTAAPVAVAQPDPCADALLAAESAYRDRAYAEVEPSVVACVYHADAAPADLVAAYRLLARASIKQDRLDEAQEAIVKLLGVDPAYDADLTTDLPLYVGLLNLTKKQLQIAPPATTAPPGPGGPPNRAEPATAARVDVNLATAEGLDTVPGIGPAIAERIIAYRVQNGPFRSVAELEAVRGIGPRTLAKMAPFLRVSDGGALLASNGGVDVETMPPASLVRLNTATAEELTSLNGIGPALAARIVEFRETVGPFQSVEDLVRVRGIGPRTLEGFAHRVTVD